MNLLDRSHDRKLGRTAVSPKPRLALRDVVDVERAVAVLPKERHSIHMSWRVKQWPMYLNDQIGDCTIAGLAHGKQIFSAYAKRPFSVTDDQVLTAYEAVSGYDPQTGANDNGALLTDAAGYARTRGLQGTPDIDAYADVDPRDETACQVAHWLFGGLYFGANMPRSADEQFADHEEWTVTNGGRDAGEWGGHCMVRVDSTADRAYTVVTWGALQRVSAPWWDAYVDEALALLPTDWEARLPDYMRKSADKIVDFGRLQRLLTQLTRKS